MLGLTLGRVGAATLAFLIGLPALAAVDRALFADGWSEVTFDGKMPNDFMTLADGGIAVTSEMSVSLLEMPLAVNLGQTPIMSWRWRVDRQAPPTDLSVKGGDDRSLALYVAFPFVAEEATFVERMGRAVVESVVGKDAPGRVIIYVWGGDGQRGDQIVSPHLGSSGIMVILRPAGSQQGTWLRETVDIADDYRRAFNSEPPDPLSIAIGADTDDTASIAEGTITDLAFLPRAD